MAKQADTLIIGNIITMDERKPRARAVAAAQGEIVYVGGEETARSLCADDATVVDGEQVYEIGSGGPVGPTMEEILAAEG